MYIFYNVINKHLLYIHTHNCSLLILDSPDSFTIYPAHTCYYLHHGPNRTRAYRAVNDGMCVSEGRCICVVVYVRWGMCAMGYVCDGVMNMCAHVYVRVFV